MIEGEDPGCFSMHQGTAADQGRSFAKWALGRPTAEKRNDPCEGAGNHGTDQDHHRLTGGLYDENACDRDRGDDGQVVDC